MAQTVAVAVRKWMGPHRNTGHVFRDLMLLAGLIGLFAAVVVTLR